MSTPYDYGCDERDREFLFYAIKMGTYLASKFMPQSMRESIAFQYGEFLAKKLGMNEVPSKN